MDDDERRALITERTMILVDAWGDGPSRMLASVKLDEVVQTVADYVPAIAWLIEFCAMDFALQLGYGPEDYLPDDRGLVVMFEQVPTDHNLETGCRLIQRAMREGESASFVAFDATLSVASTTFLEPLIRSLLTAAYAVRRGLAHVDAKPSSVSEASGDAVSGTDQTSTGAAAPLPPAAGGPGRVEP